MPTTRSNPVSALMQNEELMRVDSIDWNTSTVPQSNREKIVRSVHVVWKNESMVEKKMVEKRISDAWTKNKLQRNCLRMELVWNK